MFFKFGDIVLINYPFSDLSNYKKRPCLVLKETMEDILVVFISSVLSNKNQNDLLIKKDALNNLVMDSVLKIYKMNNIHKQLIDRKLGVLNMENKVIVKTKLIGMMSDLV